MRTAIWSIGILAAFAVLLRMAGELVLGSPVVRLENRSGDQLDSIEIIGRGFARHLDFLPSGQSKCFRISEPIPESSLALVARRAGREVRAESLSYLEAAGGYHIVLTVAPGLSVDSSLGPLWVGLCWLWS